MILIRLIMSLILVIVILLLASLNAKSEEFTPLFV